MPPTSSRVERMTNLVLALLDTPRPLSLREIGATVAGYPQAEGALRQAFERDKRTLRDDGVPILAERINGDDQVGYRIPPEEYYLPDLGLSKEEIEALVFALAIVRLEGGAGFDVADKLGSSPLSLPPLVVLPALPVLGDLHRAIATRSLVTFSYRGRARRVAGYGLLFREGSWYFVGSDETASPEGALRTFRVDRIDGDVDSGPVGAYELPAGLDLGDETHFAPFEARGAAIVADEGSTEVTVLLDRRELAFALAAVGRDAVVEDDGGDEVVLRFSVGDERAFIAWVLGFGDAAELLDPPSLRAEVIARLRLVAGPTRA